MEGLLTSKAEVLEGSHLFWDFYKRSAWHILHLCATQIYFSAEVLDTAPSWFLQPLLKKIFFIGVSVQFSRSVVSNSLQPHESQHARPPCPSPSPGVYSNSCPPSRWCHPATSSSVVPFSSCSQSLPASESSPMSQLFAWGGQSTGVSALASFLPKNTQDWSPSEWTGWISLQSKGLSRVFSNTTVQKHMLMYGKTNTIL